MDMGVLPLANDFKKRSALGSKSPSDDAVWRNGFYPMHLLHCSDCWLAQLKEVVKPETLYADYAFVTFSSDTMKEHFAKLKHEIEQEHGSISKTPYVIEIGSNNGDFLKVFEQDSYTVLGIDPSVNICQDASKQGIKTICRCFDQEAVEQSTKIGPPDIVIARHVMCHIDNWKEFVRCLDLLCGEQSMVVIEVPYAADMITGRHFDMIYHEHLSYMALNSMRRLLMGTPFYISKISHYTLHGGVVVFFIKRKGTVTVESEAVRNEIARELLDLPTYTEFAAKSFGRVESLRALVHDLRKANKRIAGYGASAKSTMWLNLCKLDVKDIEFICDNTGYKQWTYSPGTDIPVVPTGYLLANMPDYCILFAWNYLEEISRKESKYLELGGKFIVPGLPITTHDKKVD